jgi:hypothetical protein
MRFVFIDYKVLNQRKCTYKILFFCPKLKLKSLKK